MGFQTPSSSSVSSIATLRFAAFAAPPVSASAAMPVSKHKSLKIFARLAPPRFNGITREKAYDFLTECEDKLFKLGIFEAYGVSYTSYQLWEYPKTGGDWFLFVSLLLLL